MAAAFRRGCGVSWVRAGIGRVGALLRGRRKGGSLRASTLLGPLTPASRTSGPASRSARKGQIVLWVIHPSRTWWEPGVRTVFWRRRLAENSHYSPTREGIRLCVGL